MHGIVAQCGGHVHLTSEPGRGTTVSILLPRVDSPPDGWVASEDFPATTKGAETILIVEDESALRTMAASVLRVAGYSVIEAAGGTEAVRVADGHVGAIDLLVTDVGMSDMMSAELVRRLTPSRPAMKWLYAAMSKPFSPADLLHHVRRLLDRPGPST